LKNIEFYKTVYVIYLVRQKVKELIDFIQDDDRVRDERRKAKKAKDKYIGMAGEAMTSEYFYKQEKTIKF